MININQPSKEKMAQRAELQAATEAFLNCGGGITVVSGFERMSVCAVCGVAGFKLRMSESAVVCSDTCRNEWLAKDRAQAWERGLITTAEAAKRLGYITSRLRMSRQTGILDGHEPPPHQRIGNRVYYKASAIKAWAEKHKKIA